MESANFRDFRHFKKVGWVERLIFSHQPVATAAKYKKQAQGIQQDKLLGREFGKLVGKKGVRSVIFVNSKNCTCPMCPCVRNINAEERSLLGKLRSHNPPLWLEKGKAASGLWCN